MEDSCNSKTNLVRIEEKIDSIGEKISSIDTTLAVQAEQLKVHIKRTNILEGEIKRHNQYINFFDYSYKICLAIGGLAAFGYALVRIIEFFRS